MRKRSYIPCKISDCESERVINIELRLCQKHYDEFRRWLFVSMKDRIKKRKLQEWMMCKRFS